MSSRVIVRSLGIIGLVAFGLPLAAYAQLFGGGGPFSIKISPQYPTPYSNALITPVPGTINLAASVMTITVDGKEIYKGNSKPIAVQLKGAGKAVAVKVTMSTNGKDEVKTFNIIPQDVSLVLEPLSSAPPMYPGKTLIPLEGSVRAVAVANLIGANGVALDPAKLSYSWVVEDTRLNASSGIGKTTLLVASPLQYRARDVSVTVQSADGKVLGGASETLMPQKPTVHLYENDPLLGILFERPISASYAIASAEKALYAATYSFPLSKGEPLVKWFLNGAPAQNGRSITLRPTGSGKGTANLSLVATGGSSTSFNSSLTLKFGTESSGFGIFGL